MKRTWCLLLFVLFVITGCGGGSSSSSTDSSINYSGLTTPAVITEDNAAELSTTSLTVGASGSSVSVVARNLASDEQQTDSSIYVKPSALLTLMSIMRTVEDVSTEGDSFSAVSRAVVSESETLPGDCGGSMTFSIQLDDQTGYFTGTLRFSDYCGGTETIDGSVSFSGGIDLYTREFASFSMSFESLSVESPEESFAMQGSIDITIGSDAVSMSADFTIRDDNLGNTYRLAGFECIVEESSGYLALEMSGRFYHPDYGYVDLLTPVAIESGLYDDAPSSGVLLLTGQDSTKAQLTVLNSEYYEVEMDLDGNDSFESTSGPLAWSAL